MERQIFQRRIPCKEIEKNRADSRERKNTENDRLDLRREAFQKKIQTDDQAYAQNQGRNMYGAKTTPSHKKPLSIML